MQQERMKTGMVESRVRLVGMRELAENYRFERRFMELCRECGNYGANWACPTFDFDAEAYLGKYLHAYIFAAKWTHSPETIAENDTPEKVAAYSRALFRSGKEKMLTLLYRLEDRYAGSVGMSAGGCSLCDRCTRLDDAPCRYPGKVRYSPEALGFDLSMVARDFLDIEMLWGNRSLPEYQVLVNAFFTVTTCDGIERQIGEYIETQLAFRPERDGRDRGTQQSPQAKACLKR